MNSTQPFFRFKILTGTVLLVLLTTVVARGEEAVLDTNRVSDSGVCNPCGCQADCCCDDGCGLLGGIASHLIPDLSNSGRKSLADKHAPAGIMGDHVHEQGEIMIEYKYMNMFMDGNRTGTTNLSNQQAFTVGQALGTNFAATPTNMTMEMHMLHMMYGWSDCVTAYIMPMWGSITMDHLRATPFAPNPPLAGTPFTTHNSGFGDLAMGALWQFDEGPCHQWIFNIGFSIPTGDLDRATTIPTGGLVSQEYPYPMRLGSGTFDLRPGITYKRFFERGSFGAQLQTDLPLGHNNEGYRVGEEFRLSAWYSHLMLDWFALSFRVEGLWQENYHGADPNLNGLLISTNRADMRGGEWINFGYGAMVLLENGNLINFEAVHPVYQRLDGIQLETDWTMNLSWSKAF